MQLQRLTNLERKELEQEHKDLLAKIAEYQAILADEKLVLQIIEEDLAELKTRHGDKRRTEIADEAGDFDLKDLVQAENVAVTLSHEGYIKRTALQTYRKQNRGGKGIIGGDAKEGDFMEFLLIANTHDQLLLLHRPRARLQGPGPQPARARPLREGPRDRQLPRDEPGRARPADPADPRPRRHGALDPLRDAQGLRQAHVARRLPEHPPRRHHRAQPRGGRRRRRRRARARGAAGRARHGEGHGDPLRARRARCG